MHSHIQCSADRLGAYHGWERGSQAAAGHFSDRYDRQLQSLFLHLAAPAVCARTRESVKRWAEGSDHAQPDQTAFSL